MMLDKQNAYPENYCRYSYPENVTQEEYWVGRISTGGYLIIV
jgi:hypothetical protein